MGHPAKVKRGRRARVFERASHEILKDHDCHPIEDMVKTAMSLDGFERIQAMDKVAKYFYPPLKAHEHVVETSGVIKIKLGGNEPGK